MKRVSNELRKKIIPKIQLSPKYALWNGPLIFGGPCCSALNLYFVLWIFEIVQGLLYLLFVIVFYHFTTSRSNRMLRDNDFTQFRHITGSSRPDWIWKIPSDVQEVTLCKFIVKLLILQDLPPHICSLCQKLFTNIFEHVSTSCDGTFLFREAWWQTVIENFDINLSADLCGLSNNDIYLFLLGARSLSGLSFTDFS